MILNQINLPYFEFLNFGVNNETKEAFEVIKQAYLNDIVWVKNALQSGMWRDQMSAAVAYIIDGGTYMSGNPLWAAIDRDYWCAPQLIVAAYFSRWDFEEQIKHRLDLVLEEGIANPLSWEASSKAKTLGSLVAAASYCDSLKSDTDKLDNTFNKIYYSERPTETMGFYVFGKDKFHQLKQNIEKLGYVRYNSL